MPSSAEAALAQGVGAVLEALRMRAVSFRVLVLFWMFSKMETVDQQRGIR